MRVLRQVSTGKLLEMQSHATAGTLIKNAVSAGYQESDVEEVEITDAEYATAIKAQEWGNDLTMAQARRIKEINLEARNILNQTDWYVARKSDDGTAIPDKITAYRAAVRQAALHAATAVNTLTAIDAMSNYKPTWPEPVG